MARRPSLFALALAGLASAFTILFRRVEVVGNSMLPTYTAGDRLLVTRWGRTPRSGDVLMLRDPRNTNHQMIKRVERVDPAGSVFVVGDNAKHSTDSRTFGPVAKSNLVGRVIRRY